MLLRENLCNKIYVSRYFFLSVRVLEPWIVITEIQVSYGVDLRVKKGFKNKLTNVLISVSIPTETVHVEDLKGRIELDDLSEKIDHRQPTSLSQWIHHAKLQVRKIMTEICQSIHHFLFKWFSHGLKSFEDELVKTIFCYFLTCEKVKELIRDPWLTF